MSYNTDDKHDHLEDIPDKFDIMEERSDFETQIEYACESSSLEKRELTESETIRMGNLLFDKESSREDKKGILMALAHVGTLRAYRIIGKFLKTFDNDLREWALLSFQECRMFLESSLTDESSGFIISGLGGKNNSLRYYFMILPFDQPFK